MLFTYPWPDLEQVKMVACNFVITYLSVNTEKYIEFRFMDNMRPFKVA